MPTALAYAAESTSGPLVRTVIDRRDPGPTDVVIDIAYSGICHSDIHTVHGDWFEPPFPLVVGHEVVGLVSTVGSEVTVYRVGDRVGVGCMVDSCRRCEHCLAGRENYCTRGATFTYGSELPDGSITQGGYATNIVVDQDFAVRIPDGLPFEAAAPLLCAGVTTWSPLRHWNVGPDSKVAVVGLGGLGHVAVKLATALGAEVTVISRTRAKEADARRLGANHFHASEDETTFAVLAGSFDLILNTVSAGIDYGAYASLLRLDGAMVNLGASPEPVPVFVFGLSVNRASITSSSIGSIAETQEVLDFCAEHGIAPEVEIVPVDQIDAAWKRVLGSDARFRAVIDISTLAL